jgi:acyl-CoA thioester hydrolase
MSRDDWRLFYVARVGVEMDARAVARYASRMNLSYGKAHGACASDDDGCDEATTEVRYGETDQMGYAHHATAVLWFEYGRVHWLRKRGLSYRDLEAAGVLLPVISIAMKYHAPGRFEDQLVIQTRLIELGKTRVVFENKVMRAEESGGRTLLVSGKVELACINRSGKIQRVPKEFQRIWEQVSGHHDGQR